MGQCTVWFPDPSAFRFWGGRGGGERGKDLVNNIALARIHGCIPAISVDEG